MEKRPQETASEADQEFLKRRRTGLLRLGGHVLFETEMAKVDNGEQTRQEALDRIRTISARIALAQEVQR